MDEDLRSCRETFRTLAHAAVVREENDLGTFSELGENVQRHGAALVVEFDKYIVNDEGHRFAGGTGSLHGSETQREIQLINSPVAHAGGGHALSVGPHADEDRTLVIDIRFKAIEGTQHQCSEYLAGAA
jgi:hypothetical protein